VKCERYFCPFRHQKNVKFSVQSGDLVDYEHVLLVSSEYSLRVMGSVSFLLHYNANNVVLEILKNDKIWVDNLHLISVPTPNYGGGLVPVFPRDLRPYTRQFMYWKLYRLHYLLRRQL